MNAQHLFAEAFISHNALNASITQIITNNAIVSKQARLSRGDTHAQDGLACQPEQRRHTLAFLPPLINTARMHYDELKRLNKLLSGQLDLNVVDGRRT
jgi:hypothetical protein